MSILPEVTAPEKKVHSPSVNDSAEKWQAAEGRGSLFGLAISASEATCGQCAQRVKRGLLQPEG